MFTDAQKDTIETHISQWKSSLYGTDLTWLYVVIGLIVVVIGVILIMRRKPKAPLKENETA